MEEKDINNIQEDICKQVEEKIKHISEEGINDGNINDLYKLIDIHKDISNEKYWEKKEDYYERKIRKLLKLWR